MHIVNILACPWLPFQKSTSSVHNLRNNNDMTWLRKSAHFQPMHYGNIFEYLSLWSEVQFLNIQKSKKSKNLIYLDFTPETCQKI